MKVENIEPQNVAVCLGDPNFNLARVWRGRLTDGTPVLLYVSAIVACDLRNQPAIDAALRRLPPLGLFVTSEEAVAFACLEQAA
jgi:hypothetical protein